VRVKEEGLEGSWDEEREREREWGQSEEYIGFIIIVLKFFLIFKILKSTKKNEIFLLFSFCVCVCACSSWPQKIINSSKRKKKKITTKQHKHKNFFFF
jgi:hypothetical protein